MYLSTYDIAIFAMYIIFIVALAWWVSREKPGHDKNASDYFLASKSLPWWAVGGSLIASNISAEQIVGMTGAGYDIGLSIAAYELIAAASLIIIAKYILPIYLHHNINTMPQFLEHRYGTNVRTILAIFWLGIYVFVNLTSVLWLGALAMNTVADVNIVYGLMFLGVLSVAYSLYGGLKAVAFTDIVQVVLLVLGGLVTLYVALEAVGLTFVGANASVGDGAVYLFEHARDKFDLILDEDQHGYEQLPGIWMLVGGQWIVNMAYWGFNQYIIQRALAAKNLQEAQKGICFAAYMKLFMPIIVVVPGIAAFLLAPELSETPDKAYPELLKLVPEGFRGLAFAALVAAIVSSIASMCNSISTIFTMDIYSHFRKNASQHQLVKVGRITVFVSLIIAMLTAQPLLASSKQAFQYIQEYTGFFTPGILLIFLLGMFWKKANVCSALIAAVGSFALSVLFKIFAPEIPFLNRMAIVFLICALLAVLVTLLTGKKQTEQVPCSDAASLDGQFNINPTATGVFKIADDDKALDLNGIDTATTPSFKVAGAGVFLLLIGLYVAMDF
ncbi:sodium:solute symporter family transporter [Catenovulum agarivorans]|uniref:sodium:solute symporter family transporter n=1 Tax=Catenovulum agarivorans TaxID=1172192 RepID=UPI000474DAE5|nr:sodium/solute symporter [Catenovulum agarivorans]